MIKLTPDGSEEFPLDLFFAFMKKVATDTNSQEIARVTSLLDQHQIKYKIHTVRTRSNVGMAFDAGSYARANLAMYKGSSQPSFVYFVYVSRKDYTRARKLLYGS